MFELHITCTKDIDKLEIDFSDGSSVVKHSEPKNDTPKSKPKKPKPSKPIKDDFLDLDAEFGDVSQDIIEKPKIDLSDRPVKVSEDLQNFDI